MVQRERRRVEEEREAEEAREQRARLRRVSRRRVEGQRGGGYGPGQSTAGVKRREPTTGQRAAPSAGVGRICGAGHPMVRRRGPSDEGLRCDVCGARVVAGDSFWCCEPCD